MNENGDIGVGVESERTVGSQQNSGRKHFVLRYIVNRRNWVYEIEVIGIMRVTVVGYPRSTYREVGKLDNLM